MGAPTDEKAHFSAMILMRVGNPAGQVVRMGMCTSSFLCLPLLPAGVGVPAYPVHSTVKKISFRDSEIRTLGSSQAPVFEKESQKKE